METIKITDYRQIHSVAFFFMEVSLTELEKETDKFSFVRNFKYQDQPQNCDCDKYFETFVMGNILSVSDQFCEKDEYERKCTYLRSIALGLDEITSITEVTMFKSLPLFDFMRALPWFNEKLFINLVKEYAGFTVTPNMSIGEFLCEIKKAYKAPCDTNEMQKILNCGKILDIVLLKTLLYM